MKHVTADAYSLAREISEMIAERQKIEQPLRGMLVSSIAGIDDVRVDAVSQKLSGSGCRMPDNHHVDSHGFQVSRRIDERLALRDARARRCDVDRIGAETLLCKLERDPRSRRALEEKIDNGGPAKRRHFLDRSFADFLERLGGVQNQEDLLARKKFESQQVLAERARHGACSPDSGTMTTAVLPSRSSTSTSTRSPGCTVTFLPTISGWIGSSRPPRSMSTARAMCAGRPKSASSSSAARTVRPV